MHEGPRDIQLVRHSSPSALLAARTGLPLWSLHKIPPEGENPSIGGLLALDSEPAHWWLYPLARVARGRRGPRWIFLRDALAVLAAGRAKGRSPTAGRSRCVVMVASALNLHLKRRRLYAGRLRPPSRSEKSPVH